MNHANHKKKYNERKVDSLQRSWKCKRKLKGQKGNYAFNFPVLHSSQGYFYKERETFFYKSVAIYFNSSHREMPTLSLDVHFGVAHDRGWFIKPSPQLLPHRENWRRKYEEGEEKIITFVVGMIWLSMNTYKWLFNLFLQTQLSTRWFSPPSFCSYFYLFCSHMYHNLPILIR